MMHYERWIEEGKRSVVRKALALVAEKGLTPPHHLYITFYTSHKDVQIADHLKDQYPQEMTILINEEFWNLTVTDQFFSVELLFGDQRYLIRAPFESLINFIDPGAEFALQFESTPEDTPTNSQNVIFLDRFRSSPSV